MSYVYPMTEQERKAAALLRKKGWRVDEPACPICHGFGTVGTVSEWGSGPTASVSWSATPCPNGCPQPAAYYSLGQQFATKGGPIDREMERYIEGGCVGPLPR